MRRAPKTSRTRSGIEIPVLGLFFLSGASALIYEVVWGRLLTFIFGGTAFAIATVLAAYMAGLAIGSWVFGRRIDRTGHPLLVYGVLEAGIALWALVLPVVLSGLDGFYGFLYRQFHPGPYALSLIRFVLSFLVLLVPTIMMGGTLPVLSKLLVSSKENVGLKAGLLYGTNTVGAVAGTAAAGFFLIPTFGMLASTWIAIVFNALVALLAIVLTKSIPYTPPAAEEAPATTAVVQEEDRGRAMKRTALMVYAASGFAALTYEVAWTKVLSGALGTSTYAFSAMLTTFLLGLSLGAFVMARLADRFHPGRLLAWSQLAIGILGLAALPLFENLPVLFVQVFKAWGPSWPAQVLSRFVLCAVSMLLPTFLMGGAFPLVARIYADRAGRMGEQVGKLYASNTIGAILGSFSAGFILIPLLGRQSTILVAVVVNVLSAALLYLKLWPRMPARARAVAAGSAVLLVPLAWFGARPWDRHLMTSGAYVYAQTLANEPDLRKAMHEQRILYFKEETEAIVAVMRIEHVVSLRINGKVDASSSGDLMTQKMVSHLPLLAHPNAQDVLVIGFATGISMGSVTAYPEVRAAHCVEMIGPMLEASEFFRKYNNNVVDDPRFRYIVNDGRNYMKLTRDAYDVIISQPSNPWIVGIGSLFTREFFELGIERLKPGGIFCQWVQTYQMTQSDFGSVLKTYREIFPHVSIWMGSPGDVILLGSREPIVFDYNALSRDIRIPTVAKDLEHIWVTDVFTLIQNFVGLDQALNRLVTAESRTITDNNLLLEFSMPRNLYDPKVPMMDILRLRDVREPYTATVRLAGLPADSTAVVDRRFTDYYNGRGLGLQGIIYQFSNEYATAIPLLEQALSLAPTDHLVGHFLSRSLNEVGISLLLGGQTSQALRQFHVAARVGSPSERALAYNNIGLHHYQSGQIDSAAVYWQQAADLEPESPIIRFNLALLYEMQGRKDLAAREYRMSLETDPDNHVALNNLAWILSQEGKPAEAVELSRRAVEIERTAVNLDTYGWILHETGQNSDAEKALREATGLAADNMEVQFHLAQVLIENGKKDEARTILTRVAEAGTQGDLARRARESLQRL